MNIDQQIRELLSFHGELRSQQKSDWKGDIPLPPSIERFYLEIGPVDILINGYGNPYYFPKLSNLWHMQAGYRWNSQTNQRIATWDDDWLVVADEGGDPFILSRRTERILLASHGTGEWMPEEAFSSVNVMAACLGVLGWIVKHSGDSLTDNNFRIKKENYEHALNRISEFVGSIEEAEIILSALVWGVLSEY